MLPLSDQHLTYSEHDDFENEYGVIRLNKVHKYFQLTSVFKGATLENGTLKIIFSKLHQDKELSKDDLDLLTELYRRYRDKIEYMGYLMVYDVPLNYAIEDKSSLELNAYPGGDPCRPIHYTNSLAFIPLAEPRFIEEPELRFRVVRKRGNEKYIAWVKKRLDPLLKAEVKTCFDPAYVGQVEAKFELDVDLARTDAPEVVRFLKCVVDLDGDYDFFDENPDDENFIAYDDGFGNEVSDPEDEDFILYPIWDIVFEKGWTFDKAELEKQKFPIDDWLECGVCEFAHIYHKLKRKRKCKTNMLYITGSMNQHQANQDGYDRGWLSFGRYFNNFITNLRKKYGKIEYIRAWQSHESGYPHFHAMLFFKNKEFTVVKWIGKKGKNKGKPSFRLAPNSSDRRYIKKAFKGGFIDIICLSDSKEAFEDVLKYVTRDLEGGESDLTNTMVWYFKRQAWAMSKSLKEMFGVKEDIDSEQTIENEVFDEIDPNKHNYEKKLIRIEIFPLFTTDFLLETMKISDKPPPDDEVFDGNYDDFLNYIKFNYVKKEVKNSKCEVPVYRWVKMNDRLE